MEFDIRNPRKGQLTPGQMALLEAMPALSAIKLPEVRETIPAAHYSCRSQFDDEISAIFKARPIMVGPAAMLPDSRSYTAIDIVDVPILLTRDKGGTVKAFVNACRHRGLQLCPAGAKGQGRIVCPYHAWTYDLDGTLIGLPRPELFPGLAKNQLGLVQMPAIEAGGMIWVGLGDSPPDFSTVSGELADDFSAFGLKDLFLFEKATFKVHANWKLIMDSMLDSYHVARLHKDSLSQFTVDSENKIDRIGPHIRNAAHRDNFEKGKISSVFSDMRKMMVFSYVTFPNGIIIVSPHYLSVGVVRPITHEYTEVDLYDPGLVKFALNGSFC